MPNSQKKHLAYLDHSPQAKIEASDYLYLVNKLAYMLMSRLPASVDVQDMIQVGAMGLLEAIKQFDPKAGVQFDTFASVRIRGAMLDELRRIDWMPRQTRKAQKSIETAIARLEQTLFRAPSEQEIADHLELSLLEYQALLFECSGVTLIHTEDFSGSDNETLEGAIQNIKDENAKNPSEQLLDDEFKQQLIQAIEFLPERDRLVMSLYYEQSLNLKEIGAILDVSESRVSQLHNQAVSRIRASLKEWL